MWTLTTMGIGLILCVIAVGWTVRRPGHERQKAQNVRASTQLSVSTVSGVPLRSFFDGLPISPKFGGREPAVDYARRVQKIKAGRGPACNSAVSPPIVSRVISGLEHFLGLATTVHAQPPVRRVLPAPRATLQLCAVLLGMLLHRLRRLSVVYGYLLDWSNRLHPA
jgi:hypothetical protein